MADVGLAVERERRAGRMVRAGAGQHLAGLVDEGGQSLALAQHVAQHDAELADRMEHDGDAAGELAAVAVHGGQVDVVRFVIGKRAGGKGRDRVVLRARQPARGLEQGAVERLAEQRPGRVVVAHGADGAARVEGHEAAVDGVEAIDRGQHAVDLGRAGLRLGRSQHPAQHRRERPPAAVVGPFVQVAVHDVRGQPGDLGGLAAGPIQ